jgi:hypothetical protein
MDGSIAHLHCRYRILNDRTAAPVITSRLDALARREVPVALAGALDEALGSDRAVYVIRRLHVSLYMAVGGQANQTGRMVAERWAERMAGAIMRAIADAGPEGSALVARFDDQADYVTHFVADLLAGRAWDRWQYHPFAHLRAYPLADALRRVLEDNRAHLPAILVNTARRGALGPLLTGLGPAGRGWLWAAARGTDIDAARLEGAAAPDEATVALARLAADLAATLGLWTATTGDHAALLASYRPASPTPADWRDPAALSAALLDVLRHMTHRGLLALPAVNAGETWPDAGFLARLDAALARLDWLDISALRVGLLDLLAAAQQGANRPPAAPRPTLTPRQRQLLADLLVVAQANRGGLDETDRAGAANALRLYTWLMGHAPGWTGDPLATEMIARLLAAWAWLAATRAPDEWLRRLGEGRDLASLLATLPAGERDAATAAWRGLAGLGAPVHAVMIALVGEAAPVQRAGAASPATATDDETGAVTSASAGVALLWRAALDARLWPLLENSAFPAPRVKSPNRGRSVLLALVLRWAGASGVTAGGEIDPGLRLLAGPGVPDTFSELAAWWPVPDAGAAGAAFEAGWLRILAGQRLLDVERLQLYAHKMVSGEDALILGDASGKVWSLGRIHRPGEAETAAVSLLETWTSVIGQPSLIVTSDASIVDACRAWGRVTWVTTDDDDTTRAYRAGQEALTAALGALADGALGHPAADLTLALTAAGLLRLWARWLRNFGESSVPYLLRHFIRRSGRITSGPAGLDVALDPGPLDVVVEMAGYLAEMEHVPWLDGRRLRLRLRGI